MTALPDTIGNLHKLESLVAYNNCLTSLPDSFGELKALDLVNLGKNKLTSLPSEIVKLTNLSLLDLNETGLKAEIIKQTAIFPYILLRLKNRYWIFQNMIIW